MELKLSSPQNCIGDFTYNFIWHHKGAKLNPTDAIPSQSGTNYTYEKVVEALKSGEDVQIKGDVGTRVGSSLGVDLVFFGGSGKEQPEVVYINSWKCRLSSRIEYAFWRHIR